MAFGFYEEQAPPMALPHPPISLALFLVVEEALRTAWSRLRTCPRVGFDLLHADEDVVTQELYQVLFDDVFGKGIVAGFDRELFTTVTRESKVRNYDGAHLDKMPDLLIGLIDRPKNVRNSQDWLFIECKPVDAAHAVGVHYCGKGLTRFVRGEYAWAMTSALMIGYVRAGYTISPRLHEALRRRRDTIPTLELPSVCLHSIATPFSEASHISEHGRTFRYIETNEVAPAILIRHLWLRRD